ncbi:MAG: helix-turn-helix domain-containing protein [Symploca sp. SIO2B6]|nr:helix-turn-helix domain-containing protein [Symploca sp. SIO2B6]
MLTRRVTYRIYPNKAQSDKLHWARKMHCELYNAAIANRRTQYKKFNHSVDYFEQQSGG